jgi:hypothetical protein
MHISPKAHSTTAGVERAIQEGNIHDVLALVDRYGLSSGDRIALGQESDRRPKAALGAGDVDVHLAFERWDQARTVADVWARKGDRL